MSLLDSRGIREPPFLIYKGQACFHCLKESSTTPLHRCSGCFHVSYCGSQCQRANWPKHKATCKAFNSMEKMDGAAIYAPFGSLSKDAKTSIPTNRDQLNRCLDRVAEIEMECLERHLGRKLRGEEKRIVGHEPRCLACGRSDAIFRMEAALQNKTLESQGLKSCPECEVSFYCSEGHWKAVKQQHQNVPCQDGRDNLSQCQMNQMQVQDACFDWFITDGKVEPFKWAPQRTLDSWRSLRGVDWSHLDHAVMESFGGVQCMQDLLLAGPILRGITEGLSMPMTILWALENLNSDDAWTKKDTLNIHILGPAEKEVLYAPLFEEILHRVPLVNNLKLTFCGPELVQYSYDTPSTMECDTCPDCKQRGRKRIYSYHPTTYHEYIFSQGASFKNPDLAVAFNSGFSQEPEDVRAWIETFVTMVERKIPSLFTAYNQEEADVESKMLQAARAKLHPELGPRRNVWSSLLSRAEPNKVTGFFSHNGWLVGGFR